MSLEVFILKRINNCTNMQPKKKQCDSVICFNASVFQFTFSDASRINLCLQHFEELKKYMKNIKEK